MTLSDLANVRIDSQGGYKFIVIRVSDGVTDKLIIRANERCDYHRDILDLARSEAFNLRMICIGGGQINVNPGQKIISIWDRSGDFGKEPDRGHTALMLKAEFPDFDVIIR